MKLFSKRHKILPDKNTAAYRHTPPHIVKRRSELITPETRNRLVALLNSLASQGDTLAPCMVCSGAASDTLHFDPHMLDHFSLAELGYRMSDFFVCERGAVRSQSLESWDDERLHYCDDAKLFDLIEMTVLFAHEHARQEMIDHINAIFHEEASLFHIEHLLIVRSTDADIKQLADGVKDTNLQSKIALFVSLDKSDHITAAKVSTEIVNILFSNYLKHDKKREITQLRERLADKLTRRMRDTDSADHKRARLNTHLNTLLTIAKELNNDVYDIRHTEKSTIEVTNPALYKLIARLNISIAELALTTLKDDYILGDDWERMKERYVKKYSSDDSR